LELLSLLMVQVITAQQRVGAAGAFQSGGFPRRPASSMTPLRYCSAEPLQRRARHGGSSAAGRS